ncbi:hypothetical protein PR048_006289 [Dryococelus australis]|uniref:Uncharacterized protein n=1 Tax=Dryococelus australis TaxID=614101 RepID=A0ABQ9IAJ3_9NEOP|nr:hypothetical protein PR048_006289 [Dryococelus australis]
MKPVINPIIVMEVTQATARRNKDSVNDRNRALARESECPLHGTLQSKKHRREARGEKLSPQTPLSRPKWKLRPPECGLTRKNRISRALLPSSCVTVKKHEDIPWRSDRGKIKHWEFGVSRPPPPEVRAQVMQKGSCVGSLEMGVPGDKVAPAVCQEHEGSNPEGPLRAKPSRQTSGSLCLPGRTAPSPRLTQGSREASTARLGLRLPRGRLPQSAAREPCGSLRCPGGRLRLIELVATAACDPFPLFNHSPVPLSEPFLGSSNTWNCHTCPPITGDLVKQFLLFDSKRVKKPRIDYRWPATLRSRQQILVGICSRIRIAEGTSRSNDRRRAISHGRIAGRATLMRSEGRSQVVGGRSGDRSGHSMDPSLPVHRFGSHVPSHALNSHGATMFCVDLRSNSDMISDREMNVNGATGHQPVSSWKLLCFAAYTRADSLATNLLTMPTMVIEMSMEQLRNERAGEPDIPEKTRRPAASSGHDSHMRKYRYLKIFSSHTACEEEWSRVRVSSIEWADSGCLTFWRGPQWLSGLPAHLPSRRTGFDPRPGHTRIFNVGIVPDYVTARRVFSGISRFPRC